MAAGPTGYDMSALDLPSFRDLLQQIGDAKATSTHFGAHP